MKLKFFLMTLMVTIILSLLVSCNIGGAEKPDEPSDEGSSSEGENNDNDYGDLGEILEHENLIYGPGVAASIVYIPDAAIGEYVNTIYKDISDTTGTLPLLVNASLSTEDKDHEIVIGRTERAVSKEAYSRLEKLRRELDDDFAFVIYSSGTSVAIAYDDDSNGYALKCALEYFIENYIASALVLSQGTKHSEVYNLYEYYKVIDEEYMNECWDILADVAGDVGDELVAAMKIYYSLYTNDIVSWFANLYDTETGGFYYSNSGRDNFPYLPDAESTNQALGFLEASGMCRGIGNYTDLLPDWMDEQIINFIYNLQDPDGYFYHPQWGKDIGVSRRSRDYNWCLNILSKYGVDTKYPTIGDVGENEPASVINLTGRLNGSTVSAVSKVISSGSTTLIPDHLKTVAKFKEYLVSLNVRTNSYSAGNTLSSQMSQIRARGQEYVDAVVEHLNANQFENGLWHETANYYGINGLMKISGVYSGCRAEIPNGEAACLAAINAILSDEEVKAVVDLWNAWEATVRVLENIKTYSAGGADVRDAIQKTLVERSVEAIKVTAEKLGKFRKEDGSFSYHPNSSSPTSQGAPVAVSGAIEGDVNGTVIATTHMINSIFTALGLGGYKVKFLGYADRYEFLKIVENLGPIEKNQAVLTVGDAIGFDDEDVGDAPADVKANASAVIVKDERGKGNVLSFESQPGVGDALQINAESANVTTATCYIFEGEFCIKEISNVKDVFRLEIGQAGDTSNIHRLVMRPDGDKLALWEVSANTLSKGYENELGPKVSLGEWFKLRIEYYKGDHKSVRIKIFFNDKLCAVTDNYYDPNGIKLTDEGIPLSTYKVARIYILKDYSIKFLCDNLHAYKTMDTYKTEKLAEPYASNPMSINVDAPPSEECIYDFEEIPNDIYANMTPSTDKGTIEKVETSNGNALLLSNGASLIVPYTLRSKDANCAEVELKLDLSNAGVGKVFTISFLEQSSKNTSIASFTVSIKEGSNGRIAEFVDTTNGKVVTASEFSADGITTVKLQYYKVEKCVLFFVNDRFVAVSNEIISSYAKYNFRKVQLTTSAESGAVIVDDITVEYLYSSFEDTTKPKYDSIEYDFENGFGNVEVVGMGTSITNNGASDKELGINNEYSNTKITFPINMRDDVVNAAIFEFTARFKSISEGEIVALQFTDSLGGCIVEYKMMLVDGKIHIYEASKNRSYSIPVPEILPAEEHTYTFEFYPVNPSLIISVDGTVVYETGLFEEGAELSVPAGARIVTLGNTGYTYVDDVKCEALYKIYNQGTYNNAENNAEVITFDYSSGMIMPSYISKSLNSIAPSLRVTEVLKNSVYDKVLEFKTTKAPNNPMDFISIEKTSGVEGAISYVFETDMMFSSDLSKNTSIFQLNLCSGGKEVIKIEMSTDSTGVQFYQKGSSKNQAAKFNEWITLRVEYYAITVNGVVEARAKVFVNNVLLYVADNSLTTPVPTSITKVTLNAIKAAAGTVYLDNISLRDSTDAYTE